MDCAEELFAEHGLAGVSLRAINARADLSPAALHYHFGTKDALVEALLERRMSSLMERRKELFDGLMAQSDAESEPPTARELMQAMLLPLVELLESDGESGARYLRMLCRLQADGDLEGRFNVFRYGKAVNRLEPMLEKALPDFAPDTRIVRLRLALDLMLRGLADWPGFAASKRGASSLSAYIEELLDFLAGGLAASSTHVSSSREGKLSSAS